MVAIKHRAAAFLQQAAMMLAQACAASADSGEDAQALSEQCKLVVAPDMFDSFRNVTRTNDPGITYNSELNEFRIYGVLLEPKSD